jgi:transcription elongation factor Elf1
MIIKEKDLQNVKSATAVAGQKQEQDVAFFLRREFKDHPQVLVINDYKFSFDDETAQIDHLIVYPYGCLLIESKSIRGEVKVNALGEWTRSSNSNWFGMPSPIKQAELQQKLLRELLHHHRADILGKLLGFKQQSFEMRKWNILCAVSSNSIIDRESIPKNISDVVVKSEFLIDRINKVMDLKSPLKRAFSISDVRPAFSDDELKSITDFLIKNTSSKANKVKKKESKAVDIIQKEGILKCKKCNDVSNFTAEYGRYGYFINCKTCDTNTSMKIPCLECKSKNTKVSKNKEIYTLNCSDCDKKLQLIS